MVLFCFVLFCFVFFVRSEHNLKSGSPRGRFLTISYLCGVNDAYCNSEIGPMSNGLLRFMNKCANASTSSGTR